MSQVCALWNLGSKGQRSRSQCKDYWKWFLANNCFRFTPILMKLHMQSPHESNMDPMYSEVKGQGHNARITENGFKRVTASPLTYPHETSHAVSPWVKYGPYGLWGQKVKGQGHNASITENGFWRITASALHQSSCNFTCSLPMSRIWTIIMYFGVKRSKVKVTMQGLLKMVSSA